MPTSKPARILRMSGSLESAGTDGRLASEPLRARRSTATFDRRIALRVALCVFAILVGFTRGRLSSTDELGVFDQTKALYENGNLVVRRHRHAFRGADGRLYSQYAIGQSVLALPFYAAGRLADSVLPRTASHALAGRHVRFGGGLEKGVSGGKTEIFFAMLYPPAAVAALAAVVFLFQRSLGVSRRGSVLSTGLIILAGYPATHGAVFMRHCTETLFLVGGLLGIRLYSISGSLPSLAWGCGVAGLAFLVRMPAALAAPGLAVYLLLALRTRSRAGDRLGPATLIWAGAPLLSVVGVHLAVNYIKWGGVLASPMTAAGLELSPEIGRPLMGYLMSPGIGIFAYSPLLLLLPWTLSLGWREYRSEFWSAIVLTLTILLFVSSYAHWTGLFGMVGPRYLLGPTVVLSLFLGPWLGRNQTNLARAAVAGLAVAGTMVQLGLLASSLNAVIRAYGYTYGGSFPFLFELSKSPIVGHWDLLLQGQTSLWLFALAKGWPGHAAHPVAAGVLVLVWLCAIALSAGSVLRILRQSDQSEAAIAAEDP